MEKKKEEERDEERKREEKKQRLEIAGRREVDKLLGRWKKGVGSGGSGGGGGGGGGSGSGGGSRGGGGGGRKKKEELIAGGGDWSQPNGDEGERIRDLSEIRAAKDRKRKKALFDDIDSDDDKKKKRSKGSTLKSSNLASGSHTKSKVTKKPITTGSFGKRLIPKSLAGATELKMLTENRKDKRTIDEIEREYRQKRAEGGETMGSKLRAKAEAMGKVRTNGGEMKVVIRKLDVGKSTNEKQKATGTNGNGKRRASDSDEEEEDYEEEFIDDDEDDEDDLFGDGLPRKKSEAYPTQSQLRDEIVSIFRKGREPLRKTFSDDDDSDMEVGMGFVEKEEKRS
jgi:hypothetical protein